MTNSYSYCSICGDFDLVANQQIEVWKALGVGSHEAALASIGALMAMARTASPSSGKDSALPNAGKACGSCGCRSIGRCPAPRRVGRCFYIDCDFDQDHAGPCSHQATRKALARQDSALLAVRDERDAARDELANLRGALRKVLEESSEKERKKAFLPFQDKKERLAKELFPDVRVPCEPTEGVKALEGKCLHGTAGCYAHQERPVDCEHLSPLLGCVPCFNRLAR